MTECPICKKPRTVLNGSYIMPEAEASHVMKHWGRDAKPDANGAITQPFRLIPHEGKLLVSCHFVGK
jgi:hypothetical protein